MSTQQEDTRDITKALLVILAVGLLIFFALDGGWIGLGLYVVVLLLIFGGAG